MADQIFTGTEALGIELTFQDEDGATLNLGAEIPLVRMTLPDGTVQELANVAVVDAANGQVLVTLDELTEPGIYQVQAEIESGPATYLSEITRFFVRRALG